MRELTDSSDWCAIGKVGADRYTGLGEVICVVLRVRGTPFHTKVSRGITIVELVDRTYCNTSLGGIISEGISRTGFNTNPGDVVSPSWLAGIAGEHTGFIRHLTEIVWKNWACRHTVTGRVISKLVP